MAVDALSKIKRISCAAQLAGVLEASTEKPGNVTPSHDFDDTTYQDYLAGSIAMGPSIEEASFRGYLAGIGEIGSDQIGIGDLILRGAKDVCSSHPGGNTHLGTLMLTVPIAAGAGLCIAKGAGFRSLRPAVIRTINSSSAEDSRNLYAALETAKVGGLGRLIRKELTFPELMEASAERDRVAEELSSGLPIVYKCGLPFFEARMQEDGTALDMRAAILRTYLYLLSKYPDTFIAKKQGIKKAREVSNKAKEALNGNIPLSVFDVFLRSEKNSFNPGTTADLVSAVVFLYLLKNGVF
ncbi:MAG: triphosphoribosyl-dephospho-CoA synthase [Candidatus Altiarchaeia archaeon]